MINCWRKAVLRMLVLSLASLFVAGIANAAPAQLTNIFELDGDAITGAHPGLPDDWDRVYGGTSSAGLHIFETDPQGVSLFTQGSKDIYDINTWTWTDQNAPPKDDITNAYAAVYGGNLFFGADRYSTNGTAYLGFWLLKGTAVFNPDGSVTGSHQIGDILILADFTNGGGVVTPKVYEWVGSGGSEGSLNEIPIDINTAYSIVNSADQPSPWPYEGKDGPGVFSPGSFFEGGADLGALGITGCFTDFICETRSSDEVNAELKDFVHKRFPSTPEITVNDAAFCEGGSAQLCAQITGGVPPFTFSWSTGSADSCITVTTAGRYYVTVSGANGCSGRDSADVVVNYPPELVCSGDLLTCDSLLASASVVSTPNVGVSYVWSPAPVIGQGTPNARYNAPGTKKVVVTILATGCRDSCNAEITQNVTKPVLSCSGDELTCDSLLASASVVSTPNVGVSYVWSPAPVIGQGTPNARYNAPGTKKVVVTILATGCKDSCNAEITQDIAKPSCSLTAPATLPDCGSTGNALTATVADAVTYVWSVSNSGWAITGGQGTNSITYTAGSASTLGAFKLVLTAENGCKDSCEVTFGCEPPGEFCTYTMGGWGSGCPDSQADDMMSTQPGCMRDHYFDEVFPNGVTIGDPAGVGAVSPTLFAAKFTSALAVENFLPSGSTACVLTADVTNPASQSAGGVLGGQILALTLNLEFSCHGVFTDLGLLPSVGCYADYVIPEDCGLSEGCSDSKFAGLTVSEFLAIANLALADSLEVLTPYGASLSDVNCTATCLNERYDECQQPDDGPDPDEIGRLLDPRSGTDKSSNGTTDVGEAPALPKEFRVNQSYPNPFNPSATIEFALPSDGNVTIEIYDAIGRKVVSLLSEHRSAGYHSVTWLGKDEGGTAVASGVYFCRVQFGPKAAIQKMILLR